jgi:hypothetical protein
MAHIIKLTKIYRFLPLFFFLFLKPLGLIAQELKVNVNIIDPVIDETKRRLYDNMRKSIQDFMQDRNWTSDNFEFNEKIECNITITIKEIPSIDNYKAKIQVQSVRPVYMSSYNSTILNHMDEDFDFSYIEFQPIDYVEGAFTNNLSAVLAFYANIIIGLDYDSYARFGGSEYLDKARQIAQQGQGTGLNGWDALDQKKANRYWLIDQLMDSRFRPFREAFYTYHRLGMDNMVEQIEKARPHILESLKALQKVNRNEPNSYLLVLFFNAKRDEIKNIFSEAPQGERNEMMMMIKELDGANASKY